MGAYALLLTDRYPSDSGKTTDSPGCGLPPTWQRSASAACHLVKWRLAIPHYFVLAFLIIGVVFVTIIAWFAILFTGSYPEGLFNFVVGVMRWGLRVNAYAFLLVTDEFLPSV